MLLNLSPNIASKPLLKDNQLRKVHFTHLLLGCGDENAQDTELQLQTPNSETADWLMPSVAVLLARLKD